MAEKKERAKLAAILKIALLATVLILGLTPIANAEITFTITPTICNDCLVTTYTVDITSDMNWTWQNTTIPMGVSLGGFFASGEQIVRTDFSDEDGYVGYVKITANTSNTVDVYAQIDSDWARKLAQPISYAPGTTTTIKSPFPGGASILELLIPTNEKEGYLNVSVPFTPLTNITDNWTLALCCPPEGANFTFNATSSSDPVGKSYTLICKTVPEVPVYNTFGLVALVGIMSVVVFATVRRRR